jgi:hypothetical protein
MPTRLVESSAGRALRVWLSERPSFGAPSGRGRPRSRFTLDDWYEVAGSFDPHRAAADQELRDLRDAYARVYGREFSVLFLEYLAGRRRLKDLQARPGHRGLDCSPIDEIELAMRDIHDALLGLIMQLAPTYPAPSIREALSRSQSRIGRDVPVRPKEIIESMRRRRYGPLIRAWEYPDDVQWPPQCDAAFTFYIGGLVDYKWHVPSGPEGVMRMAVYDGRRRVFERLLPVACWGCNHGSPCGEKAIEGGNGESGPLVLAPFLGLFRVPVAWEVLRRDEDKSSTLHAILGGRRPDPAWTPDAVKRLREFVAARPNTKAELLVLAWNEGPGSGLRAKLPDGASGVTALHRRLRDGGLRS